MEPDLLEVWFPRPDSVDTKWQRRHAIAEELRLAAAALVSLDAGESVDAELMALHEQARELRRNLEAQPDLRRHSPWLPEVPGPGGALFERSPISGRSNALSAPLVIEFVDGVTRAHAVYRDQHQGPPGGAHGGVVAAAFDELLGVAQVHSGSAGYTGTLKIVYRGLTPLHTRVDYEAGVDRREGRKLFVWGRSTVDGQLIAEAEGIFILSRTAAAKLDADDPTALHEGPGAEAALTDR